MSLDDHAGDMPGEIVLYDPSMAAPVAEMLNDFNALWPGGFGGGIPYDEDRVRDWLDQTSALADLIAVDAGSKPVGYCGVYPHWRDADAAYVSILGVVPRVKGRGFGKRLLLKALEVATQKGMSRLDLHTWPGNLNAVPLYKKVGLFWVPETSVYMQNYLPGLFRTPLAREWFDRHPDWYGCFKRDLDQAPDKNVIDGMELYVYRFEEGADRLTAEIDRYGWGICGIERALDGKGISVRTRLASHDLLVGVPNAMTIRITNRSGHDLPVTLAVEPFKALQWREPFPLSLTVQDGETATLSREFIVDEGARTFGDEASEVIKSRLIFANQVLDLITGAKIQPAVDLACPDAYHLAPAGSDTKVHLDLASHAQEPLRGHVEVFMEGMAGSHRTIDFALQAQEISGLEIPVSLPASPGPSALTIHATPHVETGEAHAAMPTRRFPVVADHRDLATVVKRTDNERLHLLTDVVDVSVQLKGGRIHMQRRSTPGLGRPARFEAGPPFGISLDQTLDYEFETLREGRYLTLVLRASSRQFPGLQIQKHLRVAPGVPEIEHWITLTNLQPRGTRSVGGRLYTGGGGGLSIDPFGSMARVFTPLGDKVIACDATLPFVTENMVAQDPEQWAETWTACQGLFSGDFVAWFWKPDHVAKIKVHRGFLSSLESETLALGPGQAVEVFHVWYTLSLASLSDVRNRWNQVVGHKEIPRRERLFGIPTRGPVEASFAGGNILVAGETAHKSVELRFATAYPLPGELSLRHPPHWESAFLAPQGPSETIPMPEPSPGDVVPIQVALSAPARPAHAVDEIQLHFGGEFEMDFQLPVLLAGNQQVSVRQGELEGKPVLTVSNGVLAFHVLAELGGNLIRLTDQQEQSFLDDSFPRVVPRFFVDYHIGGIQPLVLTPDVDLPFVEPEQVQASVVTDGQWKGARVEWQIQHQEKLRGQVYSLDYLVLPGSSIIRLRLAHHNPTPRRVRSFGALFLNLAFQGSTEGTVIKVPGGTQIWTRNHALQGFVGQANAADPWAYVTRGDQSLALVSPAGFNGLVVPFDLQALLGAFMMSEFETDPGGESSAEFALALNQPEEQIQTLMGALAKR